MADADDGNLEKRGVILGIVDILKVQYAYKLNYTG